MSNTDSGHDPSRGSADWPSYPSSQSSAAEQPASPSPYAQPGRDYAQPNQDYGQPGQDYGQQPSPYGSNPYGSSPSGANPYESGQVAPYGSNPYGSNPYGSNPYAAAAYQGPYGYAPPTHPSATIAMVLGIIGVVTWIPFVGIFGFVLGGKARREIDANPQAYSGRGMATAGWVLGIIAIVYSALVVIGIIFLIIGVVASGPS